MGWSTAEQPVFAVCESPHWMGAGYRYVGLEGLKVDGILILGYNPDAGEGVYGLLIYTVPVE